MSAPVLAFSDRRRKPSATRQPAQSLSPWQLLQAAWERADAEGRVQMLVSAAVAAKRARQSTLCTRLTNLAKAQADFMPARRAIRRTNIGKPVITLGGDGEGA